MLFKELYEIIETPKCEIIEKTKNGEKIYTDKDSENYEIIKTLFNKEVKNVWVSDEIPGYTIITLKEKENLSESNNDYSYFSYNPFTEKYGWDC